ncbi:hypothetical protein Tco_0304881 [Tanacetum coccineum]
MLFMERTFCGSFKFDYCFNGDKNQLADLHAAELSKEITNSDCCLKEKKLSATLQTNLEKQKTENETFKLTALEEEVEALRKSVNNLRSRQQMGLEIEKHLKKMVCSEEKMKSDTSDLRSYHSHHRMDIVNLLEEEASQFKSVVDDVKEYMRQICVNEELKHVSLQTDMSLQENDCRDAHVSPDVGSNTITKVYEYPLPYFAVSFIKHTEKIIFDGQVLI